MDTRIIHIVEGLNNKYKENLCLDMSEIINGKVINNTDVINNNTADFKYWINVLFEAPNIVLNGSWVQQYAMFEKESKTNFEEMVILNSLVSKMLCWCTFYNEGDHEKYNLTKEEFDVKIHKLVRELNGFSVYVPFCTTNKGEEK